MNKYMKFLLPFQGMELGWEARRGARIKHHPLQPAATFPIEKHLSKVRASASGTKARGSW